MQLFYEMLYACAGDECCKISNKRFEWAKKYFCQPSSQNIEPDGVENAGINAENVRNSEDNFDISFEGINPYIPQPYITCANLLYSIFFVIVQLFIVAFHLKCRK